MPCLYTIGFFVAFAILVAIVAKISDFPHKKARKYIEECFLQFVKASPQLPKYHKHKREVLRWKLWYAQHKTELLRFDEHTGDKLGGGTPYWLVTCSSVDSMECGEESCTVDSDHVFKIKLSDAEYAKAIDGTLDSRVLIQKFKQTNMTSWTFYC